MILEQNAGRKVRQAELEPDLYYKFYKSRNATVMLSKAAITFIISLIATSGVSWLIASACKPAKQSNAVVVDSTGNARGTLKVVNAYPKLTIDSPVEYIYANDGINWVSK